MRKGGIHPRPFLQNGRGTLPQLIDTSASFQVLHYTRTPAEAPGSFAKALTCLSPDFLSMENLIFSPFFFRKKQQISRM
jgi:hypothetical protein